MTVTASRAAVATAGPTRRRVVRNLAAAAVAAGAGLPLSRRARAQKAPISLSF
jgi:hypothetical protein